MRKPDVDRLLNEVGISQAAITCNLGAILFTYRCSITCRHCLFGCGAARPDVAMTPQQCVDALAMLHDTGRVVHIAGGEAMLYWNLLCDTLRLAHAQGVAPHFIETNCSFAEDDDITHARLTFLADHGVRGLYASADPFHQEFVPAERFLRVRRLAREIFGTRFYYGPEQSDDDIRAYEHICRDLARLRAYVRGSGLMVVGTAQRTLAHFCDTYPLDDARLPYHRREGSGTACSWAFHADTLWELHIDPYGNLLNNCGIILGNIAEITPADLLARGPEHANRFVQILAESGPMGLARLAHEEHGFTLPERVSQSCELCYLTRCFLHRFYPEIFGPAEVYTTVPLADNGSEPALM